MVRDHHYKGYSTDEVVPYCRSCDRIAHNLARKTGKCILTHEEVDKISTASSMRRSTKTIEVGDDRMITNVRLIEEIVYNINTSNPVCCTRFRATNGKKLYEIYE